MYFFSFYIFTSKRDFDGFFLSKFCLKKTFTLFVSPGFFSCTEIFLVTVVTSMQPQWTRERVEFGSI